MFAELSAHVGQHLHYRSSKNYELFTIPFNVIRQDSFVFSFFLKKNSIDKEVKLKTLKDFIISH